MSGEDKKQGVVNGLVINSIGAAIAYDAEKEKNSSIIVAYSKGKSNEDIRFTTIKTPKKALYTRQDFIDAIRSAEGVRNVTYVDYDGTDKDIYVCRPCPRLRLTVRLFASIFTASLSTHPRTSTSSASLSRPRLRCAEKLLLMQ